MKEFFLGLMDDTPRIVPLIMSWCSPKMQKKKREKNKNKKKYCWELVFNKRESNWKTKLMAVVKLVKAIINEYD